MRSCAGSCKEWLLRPSRPLRHRPPTVTTAASRVTPVFFLRRDEDVTTEPVDTLAGPLTYTFQRPIVTVALEEASKQLEHITMWVVSWMWLFGHLVFPACSFSPFVFPSSQSFACLEVNEGSLSLREHCCVSHSCPSPEIYHGLTL